MPAIKSSGLIGADFSVAIPGQAPVAFADYGNALGSVLQNFSAVTSAMNELDDGQGASEVMVTSQPANGRVIARSDGKLSYDMRGVHSLADQTFTYTRDGQTTVEATVNITENMRPAGAPKGDYFVIETDSNDDPVMYYAEDAIVRHVADDGISEADILARHDGTSSDLGARVSAADLMGTVARGADGVGIPGTYYGETEALAIDQNLMAKLYQNQLQKFPFRQWVIRYKCGGTYTSTAQMNEALGLSRLYPAIVETYGSGAAPVFPNALLSKTSGDNMANVAFVGPFSFGYRVVIQNAQNIYIDNIANDRSLYGDSGDYPLTTGGIDFLNYRVTARRYKTQDVWHQKDLTPQGNTWSDTNGDRVSGAYMDDTIYGLYEKFYCDTTGWEPGYYPDRRREGPKSPEDASHGVYTQGDIIDITMRHMFMFNPCFSGLQMRSGGYMHDVVVIGANAGLTIGNGESPGEDITPGSTDGNLGNPPVFNGQQRRSTHMSMVSDFVITEAGEKNVDTNLSIIAGGLDNQNHRTAVLRGTIINGGEQGTPITVTDQPVGPVGRVNINAQTFTFKTDNATAPASDPSWYGAPDIFAYKWSPDRLTASDVTGMDTGALDALSTGGYNDLWKATSGSDKADLQASLRADAAPWAQIPSLLEYYQMEQGQWITPRTVAQTVEFLPKAGGGTFGIRADVRDDWNTADLPGTVTGDSIDIGAFDVVWNISPDNNLTNVTIDSGGRLEMTAGHLNFTGDMQADGPVYVRGGARLRGNSFAGNRAEIIINDGMFENTGICAGNVDLKIVCDARALLGNMTFNSGDRLTIGGYAVAGVDGLGSTDTVTFASGSKLRFQTGARMDCTSSGQQAAPLSSITGTTSGATAKVEDFYLTATGFTYKAYDLTGTFQSEQLTGDKVLSMGAVLTGTITANCGMLSSSEITFGQLRKFRSGVNGLADPALTFDVVMGGTLEVDLAGHTGELAHTLIAADSLTGSFESVSVLNLEPDHDAKITISGASVKIDVTTGGTGQVSVT